ncbi:MAG: glycosyl transferase [Achromobacter mucicolens]|jgi:glycosyltransferase involved in cell wall biosynthesis|uniref:glycosyltransferase n=1 Tax=Achromobacter TaxID=222 RepID=UPI0006FE57FF|nr:MULTISPECIES: glycosyltransferase [Achromobacter]OXC89068.1 glycosyl transferase [Achromobacter sp. KAs 3-5]KRB15680.1 glycosyl transferase [Achromobacter sp. Root170]MDF2862313.1 glycosyl transferase [Achromobacter mucicolens]TQJ95835.1 glycosyltransferase involved in cell wall biosynthesis [Achromobacter sp. SLBN-14]WBX88025.1 glycosyltransferase [Achromobacter mucicolens]
MNPPLITERADAKSELQQVQAQLEEIVAASVRVQVAQENLARAKELARGHMQDSKVRFLLLRLQESAGLNEGMAEQWTTLLEECPDDLQIVRYCATRLVKERHLDDAMALVDRHLPASTTNPDRLFARAKLLSDIRAHEQSDALFRSLISQHTDRNMRVEFAKRLRKRGLLADAWEAIAPVAKHLTPGSKAAELAEGLASDYAFYQRFESEEALAGKDVRIISMKHAILHFRHRKLAENTPEKAVSVALVTGSLGPGGAERQLTRLAGELTRLAASPEQQPPDILMRPKKVEVLVKQHTEPSGVSKKQDDFFLPVLIKAQIPVTEINRLPAISVAHQALPEGSLGRLLEQLPPPVHYGVTRLAPVLRANRFDVVSLWQDGTCLFGALAALLAGTPTIHLVFRGLPPNIRKDRFREEYPELYQALAQVPGVVFVSNSRKAAEAYAEWLDLPLERFHILYNGVPDLATDASDADKEKWEAFEARTQDATETIGGVFRLEPDKRPQLFIKLAALYLKERPQARFFLVGDGRLRENIEALAQEHDVLDRLLLVGLSNHVGFWYSKMDASVLLSRYEGLPNVLIEAQLLGVPVISTPAGGAEECFVEDETGHLLSDVDHPDMHEAYKKVLNMVDQVRSNADLRAHSRQRAQKLFSLDAMLTKFMSICMPAMTESQNDERIDVAPQRRMLA